MLDTATTGVVGAAAVPIAREAAAATGEDHRAEAASPAPATPARRRVRQQAKGPIDPAMGQRVRTLRMARNMTQADLAGADFTKGFVSLVEGGRTRMSMRAAGIFASRLGVPVEALVAYGEGGAGRAGELLLLQAEAHLSAGRFSEALVAADALGGKVAGGARARLARLRGRALVELGRPKEAVIDLDDALRRFRSAGQRDLAARTLFDLALAHAACEAHGEALSLALQCEQALVTSDLVDRTLELKVLAFLAGSFVLIGDFIAADLRNERARAIAEDVTDPRTLAALYENLTVTRHRQGDLDAALLYARRAVDAYAELGRAADVGSSWNTLGWVYIQRGHLGRATEALNKAAQNARENGDVRLMGYVLQTRAQLELAKNEPAAALALADESIALDGVSERCRALSQLVRARALARTASTTAAEVLAAFSQAARALEPFGDRVVARAYTAEFEALNERGLHQKASRAAKQALELLRPLLT